MVKVDDLKGKTIDGSIAASGTLDFGQKIPRFDLDLRLKDIDVTKAPPSWQLGELGATGRLSGKVDLKVALAPAGPRPDRHRPARRSSRTGASRASRSSRSASA